MYLVRGIFIAIALAASALISRAEDVILTPITVTVTKSGKPIQGARIATCSDYLSLVREHCERPMSALTDSKGSALIVVATGKIQPVYYPGMPPSSRDPTQTFWFKVLAAENSREFGWVAMGFGIPGALSLKCDVDKVPSELAGLARRKFHLKPLHCDF